MNSRHASHAAVAAAVPSEVWRLFLIRDQLDHEICSGSGGPGSTLPPSVRQPNFAIRRIMRLPSSHHLREGGRTGINATP